MDAITGAVIGGYFVCSLVTARLLRIGMADRGWLGYESKDQYLVRQRERYSSLSDETLLSYGGPDNIIGWWLFFWAVLAAPATLVLMGCALIVARPTPGQRAKARTDRENSEALELARLAVDAGLAHEVPEHLLRWEKEGSR